MHVYNLIIGCTFKLKLRHMKLLWTNSLWYVNCIYIYFTRKIVNLKNSPSTQYVYITFSKQLWPYVIIFFIHDNTVYDFLIEIGCHSIMHDYLLKKKSTQFVIFCRKIYNLCVLCSALLFAFMISHLMFLFMLTVFSQSKLYS